MQDKMPEKTEQNRRKTRAENTAKQPETDPARDVQSNAEHTPGDTSKPGQRRCRRAWPAARPPMGKAQPSKAEEKRTTQRERACARRTKTRVLVRQAKLG
jgi:hypothetical protein